MQLVVILWASGGTSSTARREKVWQIHGGTCVARNESPDGRAGGKLKPTGFEKSTATAVAVVASSGTSLKARPKLPDGLSSAGDWTGPVKGGSFPTAVPDVSLGM